MTRTAPLARAAPRAATLAAALAVTLGAALLPIAPPAAAADPADPAPRPLRRFALIVSHPDGGPDTERLHFPARDADKMAAVLIELGGFAPDDVTVLRAPSADAVLAGLATAERRLRAAAAAGASPLFVFYYSGHAAAGELRLGASRLALTDLKRALTSSHADVRIAFLDACQSGAITTLKGGQRAPSFVVDVEPARRSQGLVFITSSSADEASQESEDLRGSFFTHHLVSGLRGAADRSDDGAVSLDEAYAYAYHRTVSHTAGTRGGTQHPTYTYDLQGRGDVDLTRLGGRGALVFGAASDGDYLVYDRGRDLVVGELDKTAGQRRRLTLPPGRYVVKKRTRAHLLLQEVAIAHSAERELDEAAFRAVPFEDDLTKGPGWLTAQRERKVAWTLRANVGAQSFFDAPSRAGLFPPSALFGVRLDWLNGLAPNLGLQLDLALGGTASVVRAGYYADPIGVDFGLLVGGVALNFSAWTGDLLFQAGPRLSALYAWRSFEADALPPQDLFTLSPGLGASVSWRLGPLDLGLEARAHYLHYATEAEDLSLGFGEAYLVVGYTP